MSIDHDILIELAGKAQTAPAGSAAREAFQRQFQAMNNAPKPLSNEPSRRERNAMESRIEANLRAAGLWRDA